MSDGWKISQGADRPAWEPVRINDWRNEESQGNRKAALDAMYAKLQTIPIVDLSAGDLALLAILTYLYENGTVTVFDAKAVATRLASEQMRRRTGRKGSIRGAARDNILIEVGGAFKRFTAHNFPLNEQPTSKEQEGSPRPAQKAPRSREPPVQAGRFLLPRKKSSDNWTLFVVRVARIELASPAWKANILAIIRHPHVPRYYTRGACQRQLGAQGLGQDIAQNVCQAGSDTTERQGFEGGFELAGFGHLALDDTNSHKGGAGQKAADCK